MYPLSITEKSSAGYHRLCMCIFYCLPNLQKSHDQRRAGVGQLYVMTIIVLGTDNANGIQAIASAMQGCNTLVHTPSLLEMFRAGHLASGTLHNIAACLDMYPEMSTQLGDQQFVIHNVSDGGQARKGLQQWPTQQQVTNLLPVLRKLTKHDLAWCLSAGASRVTLAFLELGPAATSQEVFCRAASTGKDSYYLNGVELHPSRGQDPALVTCSTHISRQQHAPFFQQQGPGWLQLLSTLREPSLQRVAVTLPLHTPASIAPVLSPPRPSRGLPTASQTPPRRSSEGSEASSWQPGPSTAVAAGSGDGRSGLGATRGAAGGSGGGVRGGVGGSRCGRGRGRGRGRGGVGHGDPSRPHVCAKCHANFKNTNGLGQHQRNSCPRG